MNILEAIKSGKKFRRKGELHFIEIHPDGSFYDYQKFPFFLSSESLLAEDWELEENKMEITQSQIEEIYSLGATYAKSLPRDRKKELEKMLKNIGFI